MKWRTGALILSLVLCLSGCSKGEKKPELRIAEQYGLAYAPVSAMRHLGLLEQALPQYTISWTQLSNAAAIREAILADQLDIGFMGVPPFLIGVDQGMPWQIVYPLSQVPMGLVTLTKNIGTLEELREGKRRIAVPQPGSIQHILLSMEARRRFGQADIFDDQLATLSHPDAFQALVAGAGVDAYFATPPYYFELQGQHAARVLLTGESAFGAPFTFAVGVGLSDYLDEHIEAVQALVATIDAAIDRIHEPEVVGILATAYGENAETLGSYLANEELIFGEPLAGVQGFSRFMASQGYLSVDVSEQQNVHWNPDE